MIKIIIVIIALESVLAGIYFSNYAYLWGDVVQKDYSLVLTEINFNVKGSRKPSIGSDSEREKYKSISAFYIHKTGNTSIPPKFLLELKNVSNIWVENTDMAVLKPLENVLKLKNLYLGNNQINEIKDGALSNLPNLEKLFLNDNKISQLNNSTFHNLRSIKMIKLDNNLLKVLNEKLFANNFQLKKIYLAYNQLEVIEPSLFNHSSIRLYDFTKNNCIDKKTGYYTKEMIRVFVEGNCTVRV